MRRKQLQQGWPDGQLDGEHSRTTLDGRRTDDSTRYTLLVISEIGGTWALYPHGVDQLGVRLSKSEATTLAQVISETP